MPRETEWSRREISYRGRVQGVGFRHATRTIAGHYDIAGYVQNRPDGTVRVVAEGPVGEIDRFMEEVATRMNYFVHGVDAHDHAPTGEFTGFEVRY